MALIIKHKIEIISVPGIKAGIGQRGSDGRLTDAVVKEKIIELKRFSVLAKGREARNSPSRPRNEKRPTDNPAEPLT